MSTRWPVRRLYEWLDMDGERKTANQRRQKLHTAANRRLDAAAATDADDAEANAESDELNALLGPMSADERRVFRKEHRRRRRLQREERLRAARRQQLRNSQHASKI